jgi:hypothetical protein
MILWRRRRSSTIFSWLHLLQALGLALVHVIGTPLKALGMAASVDEDDTQRNRI